MGDLIDVRAIRTEPIDIAGIHHRLRSILGFQLAGIRITVTSIDPAVESPGKLTGHAMRIPITDAAHQDFATLGMILMVRIIKAINVRNAVSDGAVAERQDTDRYVETAAER